MLHSTEGNLSATTAWFQNSFSGVSAHYIVAKDGRIVNMVLDQDIAYHTRGDIGMLPTWMTDGPNRYYCSRPNARTIGIENEMLPEDNVLTDAQYESLAWLLRKLCSTYSIPYTRQFVISHASIQRDRSDPRNFDWHKIGL